MFTSRPVHLVNDDEDGLLLPQSTPSLKGRLDPLVDDVPSPSIAAANAVSSYIPVDTATLAPRVDLQNAIASRGSHDVRQRSLP